MAFNFKNEEDVEAYLKNIYMEYLFGCEKEKDGNACHLLGDYEESIKRDIVKAAELYKSNCDERNWARSCAKFGGYKVVGKGCTRDLKEAFEYMKKGCELNDARGCLNAGILSVTKGVDLQDDKEKQLRQGMELLGKACSLKQEPGCYALAGIHLGGWKEYIEPNLVEAYKLSLQSCEMGNPYACSNVSQMHARGEGVQKNQSLADTFKERALELHRELVEARKQLQFQQGIDT